jgi:hypothetical protein
MRCLFVNWKDGTSSQYSVPDSYRLERRLGRRRKPKSLELLDLDANAELYLDRRQIRSAFLLDIADGQQVLRAAR